MGKGLLGRILVCAGMFSIALCGYLNARNNVTKLMIKLPKAVEELTLVEEKNTILQYEVDKFENPSYLLGLLKTKEYAYLLEKVDVMTPVLEIAIDGPKKDNKETVVKGGSNKAILGSIIR